MRRDWNDEREIDTCRLDGDDNLITEIPAFYLCFEPRLDNLQYSLGEMRLYVWDGCAHYLTY
jgi:hypothetical protein